MKTVNMTCIRCPLGCALTACMQEDGTITVTGNTCPRGAEYARNELTNPKRTITSTVRIVGRQNQVVPVKTASDIPKDKIRECMEALKYAEVRIPVHIGDVVIENVANTGVDVIATKNIQ